MMSVLTDTAVRNQEDERMEGDDSDGEPTDSAAKMAKQALIAQVSGDCERAVGMYLMAFKMRRALGAQFRDEFVDCLRALAARFAAQGRAEKAVPLHRLALDVLPSDAAVLTAFGRLQYLLGRAGEAASLWRAAVAAGTQHRPPLPRALTVRTVPRTAGGALRLGVADPSASEPRDSLDLLNGSLASPPPLFSY